MEIKGIQTWRRGSVSEADVLRRNRGNVGEYHIQINWPIHCIEKSPQDPILLDA